MYLPTRSASFRVFARTRCPDCHSERLSTFSCKTRGFYPSCYAKRLEEWGPWARETLLLDVPHRQVVLTIPKTLRIFFKYRRRLLGELSRASVRALTVYFEALGGETLVPGIIVSVQTFGDRINFHPQRIGKNMARSILALDRLSFLESEALRLTFVAGKPPPSQVFEKVAMMAAGRSEDYDERVIRGGRVDPELEAGDPMPLKLTRGPKFALGCDSKPFLPPFSGRP